MYLRPMSKWMADVVRLLWCRKCGSESLVTSQLGADPDALSSSSSLLTCHAHDVLTGPAGLTTLTEFFIMGWGWRPNKLKSLNIPFFFFLLHKLPWVPLGPTVYWLIQHLERGKIKITKLPFLLAKLADPQFWYSFERGRRWDKTIICSRTALANISPGIE